MPLPIILVLLILLLAPTPGPAQESGDRTWYRVELIVFERPGPGAEEFWPRDPGEPDWDGLARLQPPGTGTGRLPAPFERIPRSDYQLGPFWWSLSRDRSGVEPILHRAWIQPVRGRSRAVPVYLSLDESVYGGSGPVPRLEGSVRIGISRFLHAELDLVLRRRSPEDRSVQPYRLQAHRRMRSGELHYIDHPLMGVIIQIRPVRLSASSEGDGGASDAAGETPPAAPG